MGLALKQRGVRVSARREFEEQNRLRLAYERRLALQLRNLFTQAGRDAQRAIEQGKPIDKALEELAPRITNILSEHYRSVIGEFGLRVLRDRMKQDNRFETLVQQFIARRGANRVRQIDTTTKVRIRKLVYQGREQGQGPGPLGKTIYDDMAGAFGRNRAATIARTETHNAASYASHEVVKELGIPNMRKQWCASSDDRTRGGHSLANGQIVGMDEPFKVGGAKMQYPGDPAGGPHNVINCRCVVLYLEPEDEVIDDTPYVPEEKPLEPPKEFLAQPVQLIAFKSPREARKAITARMAENNKDPRHPQTSRFRGRDSKDFGKASRFDDDIAVALDACLEETDKLADMFNVPPLRQVKALRGKRANADMGDGAMGLNAVNMRRRGALGTPEHLNGGLGVREWRPDHDNWEESRRGRGWSVSEHLDTGFDRFRSTVFHEFAHHIHQMYKVSKAHWDDTISKRDWGGFEAPIETRLSRLRNRKSPSVYGDTNSKEWFAENFAAWALGNKHLCDPQFIELIEELLENAYS